MLISAFKTLWLDYEDADLPSDQIVYMYLNEIDKTIYNDIRQVIPEQFVKSVDISVVDGTSHYALPTDFDNINYPNITGVYSYSDEARTKKFNQTYEGSTSDGFYLEGRSNIVFTPEPSAAETKVLKYMPTFTMYTADTNTLLLPNTEQKLYLDWFSFLFRVRDEEKDPTTPMQFAKQAKAAMLKNYTVTPSVVRMLNAFDMHR